jgi:malate synthase
MPNKQIDGLTIAGDLYDFMSFEVLAGTGVGAHQFWTGFARIIADFAPRLRALLQERVRLQAEIDTYLRSHANEPYDAAAFEPHLRAIGYLVDAPAPFAIKTENVDEAVARIAAPQFIVPCSSPRYLTRAVNARWSSLYDALYGSDVIPETGGAERDQTYNKVRGALVIARGRDFLDEVVPLATGSHHAVTAYVVANGALMAVIDGAQRVGLKNPEQFAAYQGRGEGLSSVLLRDKGLHIELKIDRKSPVGREDRAGLADIILESAVTTICDFEDTVVAVDAADKINLYRNWLATVKGSLRTQFKKNGRLTDRLFSADYRYLNPNGGPSLLFAGRGLAMVRVTGPQRLTDVAHDADGQPIPEMLLDIAVAALAGLHDTRRSKPPRNSDAGSIYIIVPKLHGPAEAAFIEEIFTSVEDILDLPKNTVKLGLADEALRTSLNLAASIQPVAERIAWLGTSRFERARSQVDTFMEAGPIGGPSEQLTAPWMTAYETGNVETALACGMAGMAQIAKGRWTGAEQMARLLTEKIDDLRLGASTACMPSPRAATLHAMHYHQVDVLEQQKRVASGLNADITRARLGEQLGTPVGQALAADEIKQELEAHCHRTLAYLVRCIDRGIGCSRVPDAQGAIKMEDRSAVRFTSLCVANWLKHGVVTREQVIDALRQMAERVDAQNKAEAGYKPMAPAFDGSAFNAAAELMFITRGALESDIDAIIAMRRREAKAGQTPEVSNRFEFLKGAMGKLESGEAFFGTAD